EIQKLEARLKVNILLIPNPHLETPHYKVQRLKHDELNQMEHVPASYEMVQQPEDLKPEDEEKEKEKRERQQAAVKGIVPDQPARMAAPARAEPQPQAAAAPAASAPAAVAPSAPGILGRLFGWFKPADKPAEQSAANEPVMQGSAQPRHDRPRDEHRRD